MSLIAVAQKKSVNGIGFIISELTFTHRGTMKRATASKHSKSIGYQRRLLPNEQVVRVEQARVIATDCTPLLCLSITFRHSRNQRY